MKRQGVSSMAYYKNAFLVVFICSFSSLAFASTTSHFGFLVDLPEHWVRVSPKDLSDAIDSEGLASLEIKNEVKKDISREMLDKMKLGNIEVYYDKHYLSSSYQNNISVQTEPPLTFLNLDGLKKSVAVECENLSSNLEGVIGEKPVIHNCGLASYNSMVVFTHSYTIRSQNIVITNTSIPMGNLFSFSIVASASLDGKGEASVRNMHELLTSSLTSYVVKNNWQAN